MIFIFGLSLRTYFLQASRSKSKYGMTSILFMSSTSQMENISGYLSGLSSPSGTDRIIAFLTEPVSNSAGQTRLPTFSRMARSTSSTPRPSSPCFVMPASRWHMPPVCSWMTFAPVFSMVAASTSESMSASMTPMRNSSFSAAMVALRVVVLPLPGEDMRLRRKVRSRLSCSRTRSASRSLLSNTLFFISRTLNPSIISLRKIFDDLILSQSVE